MTNWEARFGTPEKAQETINAIITVCDSLDTVPRCYECPIFEPCTNGNTLVWLQEKCDD